MFRAHLLLSLAFSPVLSATTLPHQPDRQPAQKLYKQVIEMMRRKSSFNGAGVTLSLVKLLAE